MNTCLVVRHLSPSGDTVGSKNGVTNANKDKDDGNSPEAKRPCRKLVLSWKEGRDVWWHDAMREAEDECEPEWMDAEDPLFMLYTRSVQNPFSSCTNSWIMEAMRVVIY